MNVMEIYRSVQGEGTLMGVPTTFVRFFACNLRCSWCFVPETPVLMEEGSWRRLGDLRVGDRICGSVRHSAAGPRPDLIVATVERVQVRLAPTVAVNGTLRCTADHQFWLTGHDCEQRAVTPAGWRPVAQALGLCALFVADPDGQTNQPPRDMLIETVEPTGLVEPVVTLTTTCGSYVAGGFLVKNCDTKYSWSVKEGGTWQVHTPQQVADQVAQLAARHVVLTGGEPTLQRELATLAALLQARGHHLTVETNATVFPTPVVPLIDLWSLSPKLVSAGTGYLRPAVIERFLAALRPEQQQWKFVVRDDADEACLRAFLERYPAFAERRLPIVLQPEGDTATLDYPTALEQLAERVRDPFWDRHAVRVLPQMHVIVWGRRRWV